MFVVDMRDTSLPFVYLTYFGGIVVDKFSTEKAEVWILHLSTIKPIDLENTEQLKDIFYMFATICNKVARKYYEKFTSERKVVISGRIPLVLLPYLESVATEAFDAYTSEVYVFDPKLKRAYNYKLDVLEIPEEIAKKLLSEFDEIVKQRHQA